MLSRVPGLGPRRLRRLLTRFGGPKALLAAPAAALSAAEPRLPAAALAYLQSPDRAALERDLRWLEQPHCHLLTPADDRYPVQLRALGLTPLLFLRGAPGSLDDPQLAVVGSRRPSAEGRRNSYQFSRYLAGAGLTVTSGLALGIDAEAHRGALAGGGTTVAVLGTGADQIYPHQHAELAEQIVAAGGALVSELALGSGPRAEHFPRRNRLISGLSLAVLVVEAARQSGSLITARAAAEQGREVFALPGSIHNPMAKGCHALLRDGARLVESGTDIIAELAPQLQARLRSPAVTVPKPGRPTTAGGDGDGGCDAERLDDEQRRLLALLDGRPTGIDQLVARSGLTVAAVSSMLLILELEGFISAAAGGLYTRIPTGKTGF